MVLIGRITLKQSVIFFLKVIYMEQNYDIRISNNRRFTGCIQCSAAHNKNNISEVLSNGSSRFFCEHHSEDAIERDMALYEELGFATVKHEHYSVENGVILAYEVMEKKLAMDKWRLS